MQEEDSSAEQASQAALQPLLSFVEGLRPFLGTRAPHFHHELHNFAASHLSIQVTPDRHAASYASYCAVYLRASIFLHGHQSGLTSDVPVIGDIY
jgi:hypothetical protein